MARQRSAQRFELIYLLLLLVYGLVQHVDQIFLTRDPDLDIDQPLFSRHLMPP
jgi:hypothetical protein